MKTWILTHRFTLARRVVQLSILGLYMAANAYGFMLLSGNLSSSLVMGTIPLADPFAVLQMFAAGALVGMDVLLGALIIFTFLYGCRRSCVLLMGLSYESRDRCGKLDTKVFSLRSCG